MSSENGDYDGERGAVISLIHRTDSGDSYITFVLLIVTNL